MQKQALRKKTPPEPTIDLPGYIIYHSSRPPAQWRKDVLELIEGRAHYLLPYRLALPLTPQPAFASPVLAVVAILAILLGSAIGLAGTLELRRALIGDDGGAVVSTGVFRLSRNPIVLGLHIVAIGYLITIPSLLMAVGLVVFWRHMETRIGIEEPFLLNRHPERYRRYRRSVGRYLRWWGRAP